MVQTVNNDGWGCETHDVESRYLVNLMRATDSDGRFYEGRSFYIDRDLWLALSEATRQECPSFYNAAHDVLATFVKKKASIESFSTFSLTVETPTLTVDSIKSYGRELAAEIDRKRRAGEIKGALEKMDMISFLQSSSGDGWEPTENQTTHE